jgi:hypothetical protein
MLLLPRLRWLLRRVLDSMIGFLAAYTFAQFGATGNYSDIAFKFIVVRALCISVFASRLLETDSSQSLCDFKSHVKSSCHSLILFLSFLLNHLELPSPGLDPIHFFLDYFASRLLFSTSSILLLPFRSLPNTSYKHCARNPRKISSSIVKNVCLLVRYLSMGVLQLLNKYASRECLTEPMPSNGYTCNTIL